MPCPTCFLTRATAAALRGDLAGAMQAHPFGPLVAAVLVAWSLLAIRQGRLLPRPPPALRLGGAGAQRLGLGLAAVLLAVWLLRLGLRAGLGWATFPSG